MLSGSNQEANNFKYYFKLYSFQILEVFKMIKIKPWAIPNNKISNQFNCFFNRKTFYTSSYWIC